MSLSRAEQETIITRSADESEWCVYTCDPAVKRRLLRIAKDYSLSVTELGMGGIEIHLPLSCVRIQYPYVCSEQEIERRRDHGRRIAAARMAKRATAPIESGGCSPAPKEGNCL